ncbi:MAG: DmsC/YnfH family molybdoenzyme membrane anchor subunit, partial [Nitrospinota bacterium]
MAVVPQSAGDLSAAGVLQEAFAGRWRRGTRVQRVWDLSHATWFTLMGLGGGVFILARLLNLSHDLGLWFGLPAVDIVSFVVISVGGLILITDLGKPLRFLRALVNVRTSWISRGAVADFVFLVLGALLILPNLKIGQATPFSALPWTSEAATGLGKTLEGIAILAAILVTFYAGAVLAAPRSVPYWNSTLVPGQFLISSAAMS